MRRRNFLKLCAAGIIGGVFPMSLISMTEDQNNNKAIAAISPKIDDDYFEKIKNFDLPHKNDIYLSDNQKDILKSSFERLERLQYSVGYAKFALVNFDEALAIAKDRVSVGSFTKEEIAFLEMIFYNNAQSYGFFGLKQLKNITDKIIASKAVKIENTGNYIYSGLAVKKYEEIKKDIGDSVILTSGIRSIIKQFYLFLNKVYRNEGNLSLASRSLAPPGYSYHGVGDFDVGKVGYGALNFTSRFIETDVYQKLTELGYVNFRYPKNNTMGVRFEPWHIKLRA